MSAAMGFGGAVVTRVVPPKASLSTSICAARRDSRRAVGTVVQDVEEGGIDAKFAGAVETRRRVDSFAAPPPRGRVRAGAPADDRAGDALRGAPTEGRMVGGEAGEQGTLGEGEREGVAGLGGSGSGGRG